MKDADSEHDSSLSIALISEHASPLADDIGSVDAGGQNVFVKALALTLGAFGNEVTVYTRRTSAGPPDTVPLGPNAEVVHVAAGPARELPKEDLAPFMGDFGDQLALLWRDRPPDIVHAHYWMSGIAALAGARRTAIPVVATFHALGLERIRHHRNGQFLQIRERERVGSERAVAHIADAVVALTANEVEYLTGPSMGVSAAKITVIPVGVDLAMFGRAGPALRRNDRSRLVTVGRLVTRKGIEAVISAVGSLSRDADVELIVAGGPAPADVDDDPVVRSLREHARGLGVLGRVGFLGRMPHDAVPALLRSADIFVCAPDYEPFGTAALEAAACGVPVVAKDVPGLRSHVIDGVTGRLVAGGPDDLAAALVGLLGDPAARERLGEAGAERARRYAWPRVTEEILAVYRGVLARR